MYRAIQLGKNAQSSAAPNPMVGAVLVYKDHIIGEGYTSSYGGKHAEVNAIQSVRNKSLLSQATLYVTLEPCSHYGKTPPCSDLIIEHKIPKVVIGIKDPHYKVAGRGIAKLQSAGVLVTIGVLEDACREHHKRFLKFHEQNRPYIILKWAESHDGFLAPNMNKRSKKPKPYWISNTYSKQLAHKWRTETQAILVGTQTVLDDNPKLNARHWKGRSPTRIILDRTLKIPSQYQVLDPSIKTIVLTEVNKKKSTENLVFELIDFKQPIAKQIAKVLYRHQITSLLVEGGAKTLQTFIDENLWDEARIFKGKAIFYSGIKSPRLSGQTVSNTQILDDALTIYRND